MHSEVVHSSWLERSMTKVKERGGFPYQGRTPRAFSIGLVRSIDTFVTHLFSLIFPCLLYVIHQKHLEIAPLIDQRREESKPNTSSSFLARVDGIFFLPQLSTSRVGSFNLPFS